VKDEQLRRYTEPMIGKLSDLLTHNTHNTPPLLAYIPFHTYITLFY